MGVREQHASGSKAVNVRSLGCLVAQGTDPVVHVIDAQEQHVRPLLPSLGARPQEHQEGSAGGDRMSHQGLLTPLAQRPADACIRPLVHPIGRVAAGAHGRPRSPESLSQGGTVGAR